MVKKAEQERQVTIYASSSLGYFPTIEEAFQKKYPRIKLVSVLGREDYYSRPPMEHRAGKYLVDLIIGSPSRLYLDLFRAKLLEPIPPALILPEVTDLSHWWQGKHHYVDPEAQYVFLFESSIYGPEISYNTRLVNSDEIKSIWDIFVPKWKGKIEAPDIAGFGGLNSVNFLYHHPEIGPKFLSKLYQEMDITMYRNFDQAVDWLATGKFALCLACRRVPQAKSQGLPVDDMSPYQFKEKPGVGGGSGGVVRAKRAPHPNAAKVFLNWFLSRDGQLTYRLANKLDQRKASMREDLPADVLPEVRRIQGVDYIFVNRHDQLEYRALTEFAKGLGRKQK